MLAAFQVLVWPWTNPFATFSLDFLISFLGPGCALESPGEIFKSQWCFVLQMLIYLTWWGNRAFVVSKNCPGICMWHQSGKPLDQGIFKDLPSSNGNLLYQLKTFKYLVKPHFVFLLLLRLLNYNMVGDPNTVFPTGLISSLFISSAWALKVFHLLIYGVICGLWF